MALFIGESGCALSVLHQSLFLVDRHYYACGVLVSIGYSEAFGGFV
jgi:hypothetical protein